MTLDDLNCRNCFQFTTGSRPIVSESTRPVFAKFSGLAAFWGVDDCCEMGLRIAIAQETLPWQSMFVYLIHAFFRHAISPKRNEIGI